MDKILHHEDSQGVPMADWVRNLKTRPSDTLKPTSDRHKTQRVIAYVNYGQWIAECPSGDGGAVVASLTEPFMCPECWNVKWSGQWLRVVFPADKAVIEAVLLARPKERGEYRTRNWLPSESVSDIRAENLTHGIEVI